MNYTSFPFCFLILGCTKESILFYPLAKDTCCIRIKHTVKMGELFVSLSSTTNDEIVAKSNARLQSR